MTKRELEKKWLFIICLGNSDIADIRSENLRKWGFETYIWKYKACRSEVKYSIYVKKK